MTILEFVLIAKVAGTAASIVGGIDVALRRFCKCTGEDLFEKCFVAAVRRNASNLANLTAAGNPKSVEVDGHILKRRIASLKDIEIATITSLAEEERLAKITALFRDCIILPGHQLTEFNLDQRIRPVLVETIAEFYNQLPFNQGAFNQIILEFIQSINTNQSESRALFEAFLEEFEKAKLEVQERLIEYTQAIKNDTDAIKETTQANLDLNREISAQFAVLSTQVQGLSSNHSNVSIPEAVAAERQPEIDNARDLLRQRRPAAALELLEKLKQRIWTDASSSTRFRILTNIGAAKLALNREHEAAMLLLEAFQYNPEEEKAISNRALAHFLLGEVEEAARYAKKTLEQNPANIDAYVVLVSISADVETLQDIIVNVPEYLRETPQIAQAISEIARQRRDFEQAIKWGETSVSRAQDGVANYQAALARILVDQISNDRSAMLTQQLDDSRKERLKRAVELFTEAWNSVDNTEMRTVETDWIIWKSTALDLLGEYSAAIEALNTAIQIEPDYPVLYMKRALLALKQGDYHGSIGFLETIQSAPETPEAPILLANILLVTERLEEAITKLNDFLMTDPKTPLREEANRLLIKVYVASGDLDKAREISGAMRESSPTSVPFIIDAARIAKATGNRDEALSLLEEAYGYAQNSEEFQEITELAHELYIYKEFDKAAKLYEKIADTRLNSQWTRGLLESYYHSGERKKALEICRSLREKHGPLEKVTAMEFLIYNEIGDLNQARVVGKAYIDAFPEDTEMQIRLAIIYSRCNSVSELDCLLDRSFDLEGFTLRSYFDLAYLYQIKSKPERALDIMYEARRRHYDNAEAHLKYIGTFLQVDTKMGELLDPIEVKPGTAVRLENPGQTSWYIVEKREDTHLVRKELNVDHPLAQRLLGKTVNDEVCLQQNLVSQQIGKIIEIKSKYVYAFQDSLRSVPELFPDVQGLGMIKLDESPETGDSEKIRPILDFIDRQDEASRHIEEFYKEYRPPIGVFANLTGGDFLDTWGLLMSKPDLGVRCNSGNPEESRQALALLDNRPSKLIVAPISLITLHRLGAADTVVKAFGTLGIAQSTIDELQHVINEREGMWSDREHMSVGKEGDRYVRSVFTADQVTRDIDYLKGIVKWTRENCDILPCTAALNINQLRKQELDDLFQPFFIDTLFIATQPGYLLLSDDERLRSYAITNFSVDAGTDFHVNGVWTQAVLKHCVNKKLLDKAEYDKMTLKLICSNYYHMSFNGDVLIEAARLSDWNASEPFSIVVRTLANQRTDLFVALSASVDFLFRLWIEPIPRTQREYLTLQLFGGLTAGRSTREVSNLLASGISERFTLNPLAEQDILSLIEIYVETRPL